MKKRIALLTLIMLLILNLPLGTYAATFYVHDNAGLMSETEIQELERIALEISEETGFDLVILTVDTLGSYSPQAYADEFYDLNGYSDDGMLFMLATQERDWYISTCGEAISSFTDQGIDSILDIGLPYFSVGTYFEGFCSVLYAVPKYMDAYTDDPPIKEETHDYYTHRSNGTGGILMISILIGAVVSGVVLLVMRGMMNTKRKQRSAVDYMNQGSYQLRTRQDIFLYSHVSKTPRQNNNSSGGGPTHRSSSGRVHGGGGRKF